MMNSGISMRAGAALCVIVAVLLCMPARAADGGGPGHRDWGQRIDRALDRVNAGIQKLQTGLANHPNAPANVKSAADKLLGDLNTLKTDLTNAKAAIQGKDKAALQGLKGQFKTLHEMIQTDRQALKSAVQAARPQGGAGHNKDNAIGL